MFKTAFGRYVWKHGGSIYMWATPELKLLSFLTQGQTSASMDIFHEGLK